MIDETVPLVDVLPETYKGLELHEIPNNWQWAPFGLAANIESNLVDPLPFGDMPHIAPNHIESLTGRLLSYSTIAEDGVSSGKHVFYPGQLLYSKIRPYLRKAVVVNFSGLCSADMYPISGKESSVIFLKYWLLSDDFNSMAAMSQDRTVLPKINQITLNSIPIPLPPLPEQIRIADKLDTLLARVEAGRERLERVPKLVKAFRQAVLGAAVSGELTREWRGGGDAEWEDIVVGSNFRSFSGGTPSRGTMEYWNGDIGWLSSGDIKSPEISKSSESISRVGLENSSAKLARSGSVIVVVRSGILSHTLPVAILKDDFAINQDIKCFDSGNKMLNMWLSISWRANQEKILGENREGTTVQSVKYETLKNWVLSVPSEPERIEALKRIESLLKLADRLEARYQSALASFDRLTPALLAKAFRGELVPQDPNDEPASVLLERIRAQRAAEGSKPKRGPGAAPGSAEEPKRRGRPPKAQAAAGEQAPLAEAAAQAPDPQPPRRRGRPPKVRSEAQAQVPAAIPEASSYEDAVRKLEALKLERAGGTRQVSLFDEEPQPS